MKKMYFIIVIKMQISNLVCSTRFWNNIHQVRSKSKYWKAKFIKVVGNNKTKGLKQDSQNCLREENLSFAKKIYYLETANFNNKYI